MTPRPAGFPRSIWFHLSRESRRAHKRNWAKWMDIGMEGITQPARPHFTIVSVNESKP